MSHVISPKAAWAPGPLHPTRWDLHTEVMCSDQPLEPGLKLVPKIITNRLSVRACKPWNTFMYENLDACGHGLEIIAILNYCNNVIDLFAAQELSSSPEAAVPISAPSRAAGLSVTLPRTSPPSDISIAFCQVRLHDKFNWTRPSCLRDVIKPWRQLLRCYDRFLQ